MLGNEWHDLTGYDASANFCIKALTLRDGLHVQPETAFRPQGPEGGSIEPSAVTYTIVHDGGPACDYRVALDPPVSWANIACPTAGALAQDGTVDITVELNDNASLLPEGLHTTTLTFENLTNHHGDTTTGDHGGRRDLARSGTRGTWTRAPGGRRRTCGRGASRWDGADTRAGPTRRPGTPARTCTGTT